MPDSKLADLTALTTSSGDDILYVVDNPAGTPLDRKIALDNLFTRGTITTDSPVINASQTWNASGVTFTGMKFNAAGTSDANSASASLLMDLQVGGVSKFKVDKAGKATFAATPAATPSIMIDGGGGNSGFASSNGYDYFYTRAGSPMAAFSFEQFSIGNGTIAWASTVGGTADVRLTRRGTANLRLGAADTTGTTAPTPQFLSAQSWASSTNSNQLGANFTIDGSQGTGTGAGGSIIFRVAPAGETSNGVQNPLSAALTIASNRTVIVGAAFTVATLPAAGTQGRRAWVTDATSPTFLGTLTGGGAVVTPVFDNGSAWVSA